MTVEQIVKAWLMANRYDGLCNPRAECGCELSDLNCCSEPFGDCQPAYRHETPGHPDWDYIMSTSKTPPEVAP